MAIPKIRRLATSGSPSVNPYVELHCHSNFSFLDGGSHPAELAFQAAELGMSALAITDRGGVYGAVRFLQACRKVGVKPLIGATLEVDGQDVVLLARNLRGYSNLCRLLSLAHADQPKGEARTTLGPKTPGCWKVGRKWQGAAGLRSWQPTRFT